ncbi:hypothetical protein Tco_1125625 [Tanacetum coccineum]|uniref:Uncharacterized protein n=1 Tax=Tanacetum coccineum TaxID=301880 RepID=A0ABQ5J9G7_9ASTR
MPEICLPLRKRPRRTTPGPGYEVGESSAAGAARQFGPTTAEADLYGFADMLDAAPGRQMSKELGYVTELVTTVDQEDEIIYSQLDDARYDRALLRAHQHVCTTRIALLQTHCPSDRGGGQIIACRLGTVDGCLRSSGDYRSAKSRLSEAETVGRDPKDSEEPQGSDDRAVETAGTY